MNRNPIQGFPEYDIVLWMDRFVFFRRDIAIGCKEAAGAPKILSLTFPFVRKEGAIRWLLLEIDLQSIFSLPLPTIMNGGRAF